ncbi:hypothetical protein E1301_Tti019978 [Triplophysa tibetana]|uniref:Uncharacterized protein n=1 Tax=Triplophysa tibetana TaxID=1572043 RepID=A0A5A9NXK3_9TELE|nr:hypothetical protein E1301_Tti019978 [Triplophysa tibetana]
MPVKTAAGRAPCFSPHDSDGVMEVDLIRDINMSHWLFQNINQLKMRHSVVTETDMKERALDLRPVHTVAGTIQEQRKNEGALEHMKGVSHGDILSSGERGFDSLHDNAERINTNGSLASLICIFACCVVSSCGAPPLSAPRHCLVWGGMWQTPRQPPAPPDT